MILVKDFDGIFYKKNLNIISFTNFWYKKNK